MNIRPIPLLTALICLAGASFVNAQTPSQFGTKSYRDWSVTCNNLKTCMAYSVSPASEGGLAKRPRGMSDTVAEGWMTIERASGPNSPPRIMLSRPDLAVSSIPADAQLHFVDANGRLVRWGALAATLGDRDTIEIPASLNREFMSAARAASHVVLVVGAVKRRVFFVSLSGLVASGRAIDAHQGRTGTISALIDVGRISDSRVPPAQVGPIVTAQAFVKRANITPPATLMRKRTEDCDDAERFDAGGTNIEAFTLDRTRTLWSVPCGAGAYNTWNRFYIQGQRDAIIAAPFVGTSSTDPSEANSLVNANVVAATGTISAFNKGRGLGDCGSDETYAWNGRAFVLAIKSEMVPCGGIISDFWPSVLTSRIVTPTTK